jgi:hypothetical protein
MKEISGEFVKNKKFEISQEIRAQTVKRNHNAINVLMRYASAL